MFWFDKENPNVFFCDNRVVERCIVGKGKNARNFEVKPHCKMDFRNILFKDCLLYTSPSPRDRTRSRMPSSA